MPRLVVSGMLLIALVGCDATQADPDFLSIRTDKGFYAVGEPVNITVENKTDVELRIVTACSNVLQMKTDPGWEIVGSVACPGNARIGTQTVEPGEIYSTEIDVPDIELDGISPSRIFRLNFVAFRNRLGDIGENASSSNRFGLYRPR